MLEKFSGRALYRLSSYSLQFTNCYLPNRGITIFFSFIQVEDEVDEINKTEFEKLEAKLGERDEPVGSDSSSPAKSV